MPDDGYNLTPDREITGKWVRRERVGQKTVMTIRDDYGEEVVIAGTLLGSLRMESMYGWTRDNQSTESVGEKTVMILRQDDGTIVKVTTVTGRVGWSREADKDLRKDLRRRMR